MTPQTQLHHFLCMRQPKWQHVYCYSTIIYLHYDTGPEKSFYIHEGSYTVILSHMNNWWHRQSERISCKLHHYFFLEIDTVRMQFGNILPAVGTLVCVSVCPVPSAPAASAGVGALLSACSSRPAGRTETRPDCGPPPVSLHHCWALLKHTAEQNLSYNVYTFTKSCLSAERPQLFP